MVSLYQFFCPLHPCVRRHKIMTNSSVADPVESIFGLPGLFGENVTGLAYFPTVFFSQLCNSHTSLKGLQSLNLSGMKPLKAFYIFPQREEVRLLHFFGCKIDYLYPPIFFINVNNVLYLYFASFKQIRLFKYTGFVEVIIESDRGSKTLAGQKQTLRQASGRGQTE